MIALKFGDSKSLKSCRINAAFVRMLPKTERLRVAVVIAGSRGNDRAANACCVQLYNQLIKERKYKKALDIAKSHNIKADLTYPAAMLACECMCDQKHADAEKIGEMYGVDEEYLKQGALEAIERLLGKGMYENVDNIIKRFSIDAQAVEGAATKVLKQKIDCLSFDESIKIKERYIKKEDIIEYVASQIEKNIDGGNYDVALRLASTYGIKKLVERSSKMLAESCFEKGQFKECAEIAAKFGHKQISVRALVEIAADEISSYYPTSHMKMLKEKLGLSDEGFEQAVDLGLRKLLEEGKYARAIDVANELGKSETRKLAATELIKREMGRGNLDLARRTADECGLNEVSEQICIVQAMLSSEIN